MKKIERWHKVMIAILATAAVLGLGWSKIRKACSTIDNRWTHQPVFEETIAEVDAKIAETKKKIELVGKRLNQKIVQDQIDWRQKRQSELMSKFGSFQQMPQWARDEYQRLQREIDKLRRQGG